jgi:hypothetical protein
LYLGGAQLTASQCWSAAAKALALFHTFNGAGEMSLSMAPAALATENGFANSMGARMSAENRAFSRVGVEYPAVARVQGTEDVYEATVTNLSGNGLRISVAVEQPKGTLLSVTMRSGDAFIVASAEVVRVTLAAEDSIFEVACRFVD